MSRKILSLLLLAVIAVPHLVLAESTRGGVQERPKIDSDATGRFRRGVRPPRQAEAAQLSGRVLDSSGQPLVRARIDIAGRNTTTDEDGEFTIAVFAGTYTAKVTHIGFNELTQTITLAPGDNTVEFRLSPAPTAQLRTTAGQTLTIDANSTQFGYLVPFVGYEAGAFLDLCIDEKEVRIELADIARVNGPAVAAGNTGCCEFDNTQQISLTLRDGSEVTAVMVDTCQGSKMDVLAWDRVAEKSIFVPMAQVAEIIFP